MFEIKPTFLRRWHYETCFSGNFHIDAPLDTPEEEIREKLERMWSSGNWIPSSLRQGEKIEKK
ncbi:MAG: hypothetical protein COU51_00685 [Parcubacteria group bacterium CG10_big_fil_rev_8_21_14_0_10_36_14]|nr:MAG: hypothetical protein COU51_00685 [Parcubacteria group bacterium CG10_big_fil_rev_8_21_14_0_10_36_14]